MSSAAAAGSEGLLSSIYDCALSPGAWTGTLHSLCDAVGADAATLVIHDRTNRRAALPDGAYTDRALAESYCDRFARLNPHLARLRDDPREGRVTTSLTTLDPDTFRASRFYEEWCRPSGIHELAIAELARTPTHLGTLGLARSERSGPFRPEGVEMLRRLVPHVSRAARLSALVQEERAATDALGEMVERLAIATVVVDAAGRIVRPNGAAAAMLAEGTVIAERDRRLRFSEPRADAAVARAVAAAGSVPTYVALRGAGRSPRLVTVMPASARTGGYAVVLVGRAQAESDATARIMTSVFGLTQAENRVLAELTAGASPAEAAERLGLSIATVRTHIRRVLDKTGTTRQADLMCVVHRVVPPLVSL